MSSLVKMLILMVVVLGLGTGLVVWKTKYAIHARGVVTKVTKEEMEIFLETALNPVRMDKVNTAKNFPKTISSFEVGVESKVSKVPRSFSPAVRSTAG